MRLEIGAGAAAGRAGGVLWSSAILAAISLRGAAFTSPLPAPARSAEPAAAPARLRPPPPTSARSARPRGPAACGPAARAASAARSSSEPLLAPSSSVLCQPGPLGRACWLRSPLPWIPFSPGYPWPLTGSPSPHSLCSFLPQFSSLKSPCPLP